MVILYATKCWGGLTLAKEITSKLAALCITLSLTIVSGAAAQEVPKHRQAGDGPPLPQTAKKLSASETLALLDGKKFEYTVFTEYILYKGTITFNFSTGLATGEYVADLPPPTLSGQYEAKIWLDRDNMCLRHNSKQQCGGIFSDVSGIFRMDDSTGKVAEIYR
jgi:hypothetical protein